MTVSAPFFMLVQDDKVLDCCQNPNVLMWTLLDAERSFAVALGVINEEGNREICGKCAEFTAKPGSTVFYVTSDMDGYLRLVNNSGGAAEFLRNRVSTLFGRGLLSDPCNFSRVVLWDGNTDA